MKKLLIGLVTITSMTAIAQDIKTIIEPGIDNGMRVVGFPMSKKVKINVQSYVNQVMNCTLVYHCGELAEAQDNFSVDSDKDSVCRILGFEKSVGYESGKLINVFGRILTVNSSEEIEAVKVKKAYPMPKSEYELRKYFSSDSASRRTSWHKYDGAIDVIYEAVSENVITSITCK